MAQNIGQFFRQRNASSPLPAAHIVRDDGAAGLATFVGNLPKKQA
ncbi:MAG: hypothetical protein WA973_03190 [Mesorhizobium sp.]|jgi:hypothetical protein